MKNVATVLNELGWNHENTGVVSGIGCSGRMASYMNFDAVHTPHGRALTAAETIKTVRPDLNVIVLSGDGDLASIGGNHLLHTSRRNADITIPERLSLQSDGWQQSVDTSTSESVKPCLTNSPIVNEPANSSESIFKKYSGYDTYDNVLPGLEVYPQALQNLLHIIGLQSNNDNVAILNRLLIVTCSIHAQILQRLKGIYISSGYRDL